MLNLIPTLISVAVSGATKLMSGSNTGTDAAKTAAGAKTPANADTQTAAGGFQKVLDSQVATTQNAVPGDGSGTPVASISPELLAQLVTDGDAHPGAGLGHRDPTDKTPTMTAAKTAPATDLATLIGASAAAGQVAGQLAGQAANQIAAANGIGRAPAAAADGAATLQALGGRRTADNALPAATTATATVARNAPGAAAAGTALEAQAAAPSAADAAALANLQSTAAAPLPALHLQQAASDALAKSNAGAALPSLLPLPGAGPQAANASTAPISSARIDMPVGTQGWDAALGQRVVWMVSQKDQTAEIHVNPPELGPLTVTVNVANNSASANFVAQHAATRDAIADAMPKLRDMFADAGINLGQVTVSAESFSQGGHQAGQSYQNSAGGGSAAGSGSAGVTPIASPVAAARAQLGLVDTFA